MKSFNIWWGGETLLPRDPATTAEYPPSICPRFEPKRQKVTLETRRNCQNPTGCARVNQVSSADCVCKHFCPRFRPTFHVAIIITFMFIKVGMKKEEEVWKSCWSVLWDKYVKGDLVEELKCQSMLSCCSCGEGEQKNSSLWSYSVPSDFFLIFNHVTTLNRFYQDVMSQTQSSA